MPETAIGYEIEEEPATEISAGQHPGTIAHDYPIFHLSVRYYIYTVLSGRMMLTDHMEADCNFY